jgi:hypothetical protein
MDIHSRHCEDAGRHAFGPLQSFPSDVGRSSIEIVIVAAVACEPANSVGQLDTRITVRMIQIVLLLDIVLTSAKGGNANVPTGGACLHARQLIRQEADHHFVSR